MELNKILAITGKPGLYELKLQTRAGFVVESLQDGRKITIGMKANVSLLSEISIYTLSGEVKLIEVFALIAQKENNGQAISHKSSKEELTEYFSKILPTYDVDRVYPSDIKKVIIWYNILNEKGLRFEFKKTEEKETEEKTAKKKASTKKSTTKKTAEKSKKEDETATKKETAKKSSTKKAEPKKTTAKKSTTKKAESKETEKKTTATKKSTTKSTTTAKKKTTTSKTKKEDK